jgi:hypothetical protein
LRDGRVAPPDGRRRPERPAVTSVAPLKESPETEALKMAVHRPAEVSDLLDEMLFASELHAAAFRALASADTLQAAIDEADPGAADLLQRLAVEETEADAVDVAARLAEEAAMRELGFVEAEARRADDALAFSSDVRFLKLSIERLREPDTAAAAVGELVPWLRHRLEGRA